MHSQFKQFTYFLRVLRDDNDPVNLPALFRHQTLTPETVKPSSWVTPWLVSLTFL